MPRYVVTRLGQGLVTLFVLVTLVFLLARLIGNPVDVMLGPEATPQQREQLIRQLGLDRPLYEQYFDYMRSVVTGDMGISLTHRRPVSELFFQALPNTLKLLGVTVVLALVLGFVIGVASGTRPGSVIDHVLGAFAAIGISAPNFWVGLILIMVFAVYLGLLPVARMSGPASYILPAFTWSLFLLSGIARLVRSSVIDVLDQEYIKLARIKGVPEWLVVWKHCLRNALLPVVTFAGLQIALLLNGSVVVESVFAWPGVGRLIYQGITGRDYPLVQGCILIGGFFVVMMSLLVDLIYALIDPRIRVSEGRS